MLSVTNIFKFIKTQTVKYFDLKIKWLKDKDLDHFQNKRLVCFSFGDKLSNFDNFNEILKS